MQERGEISSIKFLKEAFNFKFNRINNTRIEDDDFPLSIIEKVDYIIKTLASKEKTTRLINLFSAINYGADILNAVFPKYDNPEEYHSTDTTVRLDEHPVQVMGWSEYEELIAKGVEDGLDRDEIIGGFFLKAKQRGINLEHSFHSQVPMTKTDTLITHQQLP
jgi:hypothetical protein